MVLEVSEHLELEWREKYHPGQVWRVYKDGKTGKQHPRCRAVLLEDRGVDRLPPEVDVAPVLATLFHVPVVAQIVPNPMPGRIYVDVESLPPPRSAAARPKVTAEVLEDRAKAGQYIRDFLGGGSK